MRVESNFWTIEGCNKLHPRLAVEMLLDAFEFDEGAKNLIGHLRNKGYDADMLRTKGYINQRDNNVVCILPFTSHDMQSVASISMRRNMADEKVPLYLRGTIVKTTQAVNPSSFSVLIVEKNRVKELETTSFKQLMEQGAKGVLKSLGLESNDNFWRLSKGRALSGVVLNDLASEELKLGFISQGEYNKMMGDSEIYSEVARLHAYISTEQAAKGGGCTACCSSSCYACSSCSCSFDISISLSSTKVEA